MNAERTPGPWETRPGSKIETSDGRLIVYSVLAGVTSDTPYGHHELAACKANAEFIVRACNAHDELVEVLRDVAWTPSAVIDSRAAHQLLMRLELLDAPMGGA